MKVDLHVHTSERSLCGKSSEEEQIRAAVEAGLDAIAFTDHNKLAPAERIEELRLKYPGLWILGGIELTAEREDLIVLGLQDRALESDAWTYLDLRRFVADGNGFLAIAHPFRYHEGILVDVESAPPDAIEAYSCSTPPEAEEKIRGIAGRAGIPVLSNSDAHRTVRIGRWYNILARRPSDERELLAILKAGDFECYADEGGADVEE